MRKYTKINTIYKRYQNITKDNVPNQKWLGFSNKIILGEFSDKTAEYLFNNPWEAYSKIDGTNMKIAFFPSTQEVKVEGKSSTSNSLHGSIEYVQNVADSIKQKLCEIYPKDSARFVIKNDDETNQPILANLGMSNKNLRGVELEESPIYIYGEYYGNGVQKCGKRYLSKTNAFIVFDICQQGWWIPSDMRHDICKKLGLDEVPFCGIMTLSEAEKMVRNGFTTKLDSAEDKTLLEEGLVCRPTIQLLNSNKNRIIVKVKSCDYIAYDNIRSQFTDDEFNEFNTWYHEILEPSIANTK